MIGPYIGLHATTVTTSTTRPNSFHFWSRVPFHFYGPKKPNKRSPSTLSVSQKPNYFQWSSSRASEHKYEKFFVFNFLKQILFLKVIWYIKWRTLPMPVCSGLYGPGESEPPPTPPTQIRAPSWHGWGRAHPSLSSRRKNQKCLDFLMIGPCIG